MLTRILIALFALTLLCESASAQIDFERAPIHYETTKPNDAVAEIIRQLNAGDLTLNWDEDHGWLKSLMQQLNIDESTQTLVFSKTSLQISKIRPSSPRALYFNDDVYIGWIPKGDLIEIGAVDPKLGAIFYTLDQNENTEPQFHRVTEQCLSCHGTSRTKLVPGFLTRSLVTRKTGHPDYGFGSLTPDHTTNFVGRFGGWYVSGTHGQMRHMGNAFSESDDPDNPVNLESGANCTDLSVHFNTKRYLTPHSDIVALMVLDHQSQMHNLIAAASYAETRAQYNYERLFTPPEDRDAYVRERCQREVNKLVEGLLFAGEYQLTSPVQGTSDFRAHFESLGPFDNQGRSLRQFDLETRLLKYPCSYLIYSTAFKGLPELTLSMISTRLREILNSEPTGEDDPYKHLTLEDRQAIREILQETTSHLTLDWE